MFPEGRIGTRRFYEISGLSKTSFFTKYRWIPRWIEHLDIRMDENGRLSFSEEAARKLGRQRRGERAHGVSERARRLTKPCPHCKEPMPPRARFCSECGGPLAA